MKKLSFFLTALAIFTITGCTDYNTLTPEIPAPDAVNKLVKIFDDSQRFNSSQQGPETFSYTYDAATKRLIIRNNFNTNDKAEVYGNAYTTEFGSAIEVLYTDQSPDGSIPASSFKYVQYEHHFDVAQIGRGTGSNLNIVFKYVYKNPAMGITRNVLKTIQL